MNCNKKINKSDCKITETDKKLLNAFDKLDIKMDNNIDYIQEQLNIIKKSYLDIYKKTQIDNKRYELLFNEVQHINDTINNNIYNFVNCVPNQCYSSHIMFHSTDKTHIFPIDSKCIKVVYITAIAGGGAGGCGLIKNMFYYSGGGGGSGASIIKKPLIITNDIVLKITIGKGGVLGKYNGTNTIIEIIDNCNGSEFIILNGGLNGNPINDDENIDLKGGNGGLSDYCILIGQNGQDGCMTIPSQPLCNGGNGGCSLLSKGGNGGGNFFNNGGVGGDQINFIGLDGKYGSGGGGSCPSINKGDKLSGNGGDGIVIIEW